MGGEWTLSQCQMVVLNFSHCDSHDWCWCSQPALCHGISRMVNATHGLKFWTCHKGGNLSNIYYVTEFRFFFLNFEGCQGP